MNIVVLKGNIVRDAVIKGEGDKKRAMYTLAVSRGRDKEADFINCVCFGKVAEFAEKYCKQGAAFVVQGKINTGNYEKDGQKIYYTNVVVNSHEFAGGKSDNSAAPQQAPEQQAQAQPQAAVNENPDGFTQLQGEPDGGVPFELF